MLILFNPLRCFSDLEIELGYMGNINARIGYR